MTAIAGLWRFDGRPNAVEGCVRMLAAQELYGPHGGAQWSNGNVAFGRQLMRVLPEDKFDRQPLIGADGRYILVGDVRLDNRDELADALHIPVSNARDLCDAALLLAAIERWEELCFDYIIGDYAFALWDCQRQRLLLARDPLGQRPLHYHRSNKFIAFASMPKGLHALPEIPYAADEERIAEFLVLMPETGPQSFFLGIQRVEPGHVIAITTKDLVARRHWQPRRRQITFRRPEEYSDALRNLLDQAVRSRLRGDGDVGAYLSGGLDSGAVAATAARLLASSERRVVAFTAVPPEHFAGPAPRNRIIDEGPYAAMTAALYSNMEHVLIRNEGRSPIDDLDRTFFLCDRPMLNICNIRWANDIGDAMRKRKLTVALGGDAGNFGLSYDGIELLPELFRSGRWLRLWRESKALVMRRGMRWRGVGALIFGPWCPTILWVWLNKIVGGHAFEISDYAAINPRRLAELDLTARAKQRDLDLFYRPWKDSYSMRLWALQNGDPGNYIKGLLGGWQIDYRDPTADVRLLEFCLALPTEQFLANGKQRSLARRTLADRLPKLLLDEPRKGLQAADWHEQLTAARDEVAAEIDRIGACVPSAKALDLPRLRRMVENWPSGGWERDEISVPYRLALLRGISAGHFLRRATGGNR